MRHSLSFLSSSLNEILIAVSVLPDDMSCSSLKFLQAWVIADAYDEFQRGVEIMKSARRVGQMLMGPIGVYLECITCSN